MAFAVLGTRCEAPVTIDDDASVDTSFPGFNEALRRLGGRVNA
jgi:5-enolpyruvylshikimate-3-phosphate synthase